jgi:eukaryotic translation initiation factor 2C
MGFLNLRTIRDLVLDRQDPQFKKLEKFLNKLRVDVRTGPGGERSRVKTIRGLEPFAGEFEFTNNEGRTMRVSVRTFFFSLLRFEFFAYSSILINQDYFREAYNIHIGNSRIVGIRLSPKSGRDDIVPLELCSVRPGQLYKRKLPEELTRDMVGFSAVKPQERQRMILQEVSTFSPFYSFVCALTNFGDKFLGQEL